MSISSLRFDSRTLCTPQSQHPFTFHNRLTPNVVVCAAKPVTSPPTKLTAAVPLAGRIES
ncbi:adenylosuccinate synthetase, partial [Trifolium medium]|nr:adenylosuccinate synthetase [Trifolium medium]